MVIVIQFTPFLSFPVFLFLLHVLQHVPQLLSRHNIFLCLFTHCSSVHTRNIDCFGRSSGSIEVELSNLALPFDLEWYYEGSIIDTDTLIEDQPAGDYELVITDANNCIENRFYTLVQPDSLTIAFDANEDAFGNAVSCFNGSDGSINSMASGGVPAYAYNWTLPDASSDNSQNITGLPQGTYILEVTDANACVSLDSVTISHPDSLYALLSSPLIDGDNLSC